MRISHSRIRHESTVHGRDGGRCTGRVAAAVSFAVLLVLAPAAPAFAHGGSSGAVTSNYRIELTSVTPAVPGLDVKVVDVGGTPQVSWTGSGTLIVEGYSGEPYLRITSSGVERNEHSPATYLNQTRYATAIPPPAADAKAAPEWTRISTGTTAEWHDHRTHWMSPIPPEQVTDHPGAITMINADWTIPLQVNGNLVTVHGTLSWVPPPSGTNWLVFGVVLAAVAIIVVFSRLWRHGVAVLAVIGTSVFLFDSFGYFQAATSASINTLWVTLWPIVAIGSTARVLFDLHRAPDQLPLSTCVLAVVLAVVGGFDRIDSVTNSQIYTAWPDWTARVSATISLAISAALLVRFLAPILRTLIDQPAPITGRRPTVVQAGAAPTGNSAAPTND